MLKLLTLVLLIAIVWFGFKFVARSQAIAKAKREMAARREAGLPRPRPHDAQEMVRCASCGVYVPAAKADACGRPDCPYR
ncbi:PP0621 family protein [Skermanella pratensis]|uniref:PP0621 family protein n=1 Tax=Skermanella pratensis TaxID=2233999 RepID=UPI0013015707|nr:PP0621 family protein [Skermanella pratensis]